MFTLSNRISDHLSGQLVRGVCALVYGVQCRVARRDRGDVPGWVLITIMTAGIVTIIWAVAQPLLQNLFTDAVNNVKGP